MITKEEQQLNALLDDLDRAEEAGLVSEVNLNTRCHTFIINDAVTVGQYETLEGYLCVTYPDLNVTVNSLGERGEEIYIRFNKT